MPLFIATKLEAFRRRSSGDVATSHDLEDIVMIIDGHLELVEEIEATHGPVREYIAASQARRQSIERRMKDIAQL